MPQTTYIRRVAARPVYGSESHMSRYVHGSGRYDAQLNNCLQGRFPKIPGLGAAGFSPPTVQLVSRVATMASQAAGPPYYRPVVCAKTPMSSSIWAHCWACR